MGRIEIAFMRGMALLVWGIVLIVVWSDADQPRSLGQAQPPQREQLTTDRTLSGAMIPTTAMAASKYGSSSI